MMDETAEVLSIGSVVGGSSHLNRPWRDAVSRLMNRVADARPGAVSPLNLNVVFQIPGKILQPEFEGVRTGTFRKRDSLLLVQVALPEVVPADVDADVLQRLRDAVDEAESWAKRRRVADDLSVIRGILDAL